MHKSPIWVVENDNDFRDVNKKVFAGRDELRRRQHEERRRKIAEVREKRVRGKYEAQPKQQRAPAPPPGTPRTVDSGAAVVSLAELLNKEEPDYIDEEENAALEAALATRRVDAVISFSGTLSTPTIQRPRPRTRTGVSRKEDDPPMEGDEASTSPQQELDSPAEPEEEKRDTLANWSAPDAAADNDDVDTQNEHWRKVQVRTPVDVPLDLLPATQRLETLQVQEDMKIFSDETSKGAPPPKRYLHSAWWLPRSKWRVMDPDQPSTLQNPHRPRDFSAEGHTYLPMGQELLRSGVCYDKLAEDDKKIAENEKMIENSTVGKRYKEFLISEGFQEGRHLPHYLNSCKVSSDGESGSWRAVQRTLQATNALVDTVKLKLAREKQVSRKWSRSPSSAASGTSPRVTNPKNTQNSTRTPRLPVITTPRNMS